MREARENKSIVLRNSFSIDFPFFCTSYPCEIILGTLDNKLILSSTVLVSEVNFSQTEYNFN